MVQTHCLLTAWRNSKRWQDRDKWSVYVIHHRHNFLYFQICLLLYRALTHKHYCRRQCDCVDLKNRARLAFSKHSQSSSSRYSMFHVSEAKYQNLRMSEYWKTWACFIAGGCRPTCLTICYDTKQDARFMHNVTLCRVRVIFVSPWLS